MDRWLKIGSLKRKLDEVKRSSDAGSQDKILRCNNEVTTELPIIVFTDIGQINDSTITVNEIEPEKSITKRRYYDSSYLAIGFTFCGDKISSRPNVFNATKFFKIFIKKIILPCFRQNYKGILIETQ